MKMFSRMIIPTFLAVLPASAHAAVTVSISPAYGQVVVGQTLQFSATVSGTTAKGVVWQVNNATSGASATGTVSKKGLFKAPVTLPTPAIATVTAVSKADPSVSATATVTLLAQAATGHTYIVATSGNDSNPGTLAQPWKTILHASTVAAAGDTVQVRQGVYHEVVSFARSGSANGGYITFESYPGEIATVDGGGLGIPQNEWGLFTFQDASYVVVEGFELRNYTTTSVKQVPIGIFVTGAGASVQIVNNSVHDITTTAPTNPNKCSSNALGIAAYGSEAPAAIDGLALSGNEVFDNLTGCSETVTVDGNVTNFAIVSNRIHDDDNIGIDAIGFEKVAKDPAYDQARDGAIRGNTVYNITSFGNPDYGNQYAADGIYVDGGTDIIVEQNLIHNVDLGIELASEHNGKVTSYIVARNNLVYWGNSAGISIGGYGASRGGTDHCQVVGNTLYDNDIQDTGSGEFQIQFNATNNIFENNILYAGGQALLVNDFTTSTPTPALLDYNLYFSTAGDANSVWEWQKVRYKGFAAYRSATGLDADSPPFSDPQFVSLETPTNLHVAPSSPAVDAGTNLGYAIVGGRDFAGNKRILGSAIDIGAYEQ